MLKNKKTDEPIYQTTSGRLKLLMLEQGMTQRDLAKALGVSVQAVCAWISKGVPPRRCKYALAELFDVDADYIMGVQEERVKRGTRLTKHEKVRVKALEAKRKALYEKFVSDVEDINKQMNILSEPVAKTRRPMTAEEQLLWMNGYCAGQEETLQLLESIIGKYAIVGVSDEETEA